jgi:cytochrome c553
MTVTAAAAAPVSPELAAAPLPVIARFVTVAHCLAAACFLAMALHPSEASATGRSATPAVLQSPSGMAERVQPCIACHGEEGRAGPDAYYPRIAGKPAGYLYNQLRHFRDGRRHYPLMTHLLDVLPDAYLLEMARYFASLDPPYPPPAPAAGTPAQRERGRRLILEGDPRRDIPSCVSCHGEALMGAQPAIPGLLGLPRDYLNAQLGAWKTGTRRADAPDCMAVIADRLLPEDVAAVSSWLAAQPVPTGSRPAATHGDLPMRCGGLATAGTGR